MFATLKNKIKEETGEDVSTSTTQTHQRHNNNINNNNNYRTRSRRVSINSNVTDDVGGGGAYSESEQLCQLRSQCNDLASRASTLSQSLQQLQEEKTRVEKTNEILLESVRVAQTQKDIYCEEQEKIQNLQQIEIDKLKSLLGFREQEAVDHMNSIRQYQQQIDNFNQELDRMRTLEPIAEDLRDELEQLRHITQQEKSQLTTTLAAVQEDNRNMKMRMRIIEEARLEALSKLNNDEQVRALVQEHKMLEQHLEETHLQLSDIKSSWSGQNFALEKQVSRLSQQVAEETTEKRKALKARDEAIESRKQVAFELDKANIEIKQRDDKIKLLEDEVDELNITLKECREENEQQILFERNKSDTLAAATKELKMRITNADDRFSEYVKNSEQIAQKLRTQITEQQEQLSDTQIKLETERDEKLTALLRNAEISQSEELLKKELRMEQTESNDLHDKNKQLEKDVHEAQVALQSLNETAQQSAKDQSKYELIQREIVEKNKVNSTHIIRSIF